MITDVTGHKEHARSQLRSSYISQGVKHVQEKMCTSDEAKIMMKLQVFEMFLDDVYGLRNIATEDQTTSENKKVSSFG